MSHPPSARATAARDPPTMAVRYHGPRYTPAGWTVDDAPAGARRARAGRARVGGARGARADHDRPAGRGDDDGSRPQHAGADRQLLRQPLRHAHAVGRGAHCCFTETPRTTNPEFVATNGTSRLLSVRTKSKLSVPVPPLRIVHSADPVPLGFTVYTHVKVWWSTEPFTLMVRTPSVRFPFPSATKKPTAATGPTVMMVPSRENP